MALVEVEALERLGGFVRELVYAVAEPVVFGEFGALDEQGLALGVDVATSRVELFGSTLELDELDQTGLVEIGQAAAFALRGVGFVFEAGELRVE